MKQAGLPPAGKGTRSLCNPINYGFLGPFGPKSPKALLLVVLLLSGCGQILNLQQGSTEIAELEPGNYRLDPDHAVILWKVNHLGFSEFVGRFEDFQAGLDFDPAAPEAARLQVLIDTATIDSGVAVLDEQLRGPNFFASETFPQARFVSTGIEVTGDATGRVVGDLTILGVTRPATFDVTFTGGGRDFLRGNAEVLGFEATTAFDRSEFGMTYLVPAIGDRVTLEVHLEFLRNDP